MGENDRGRTYVEPSLIFRDAEHTENFMALAPADPDLVTAPNFNDTWERLSGSWWDARRLARWQPIPAEKARQMAIQAPLVPPTDQATVLDQTVIRWADQPKLNLACCSVDAARYAASQMSADQMPDQHIHQAQGMALDAAKDLKRFWDAAQQQAQEGSASVHT
jgi:hypothetical protein